MGKYIERTCFRCGIKKFFTGYKYCDACKPLAKADQIKRWNEQHPERRKYYDLVNYERRTSDPERIARRRVYEAMRNARERAKNDRVRAVRRVEGQRIECLSCHRMLPHGQFSRCGFKANGDPRRMARCKDCRKPAEKVRAHERMGGVGKFTVADIRELEEKQNMMCACGCGKSLHAGYHIDHIIPRAKGGTHWPSNLQLLTPLCNLRKCAKDIPPGVPIPPGSNRRQKTEDELKSRLRALGMWP